MIAGGWIKRLFSPKRGVLRGFDGIAGAILAFARGVLVLAILLALLKVVHLPPSNTTEKSVLYPELLKTSGVVIGVLRPFIHTSSTNDRDTV